MPRDTLGLLAVVALGLVSAAADAAGFVHASRIWHGSQLRWGELGRSALGFAVGIGLYWLMLRFMARLGVVGAELQAVIWFSLTIIGVAAASGRFLGWPWPDRVVAVGVVAGLAFLLVRDARG